MISRRHYIFWFILFSLFGYLLYSIYSDVRQETIKDHNTQQMMLAKQAANGIKRFFDHYYRELTNFANNDDLILLSKKGKELMHSYYENNSNELRAVTRMDAQGKIVYTIPFNETVIGQDISSQSHVQFLLEKQKPVVSSVFMTVQGFPSVAYHVPIIQEQRFYGSFAILIPFDEIASQYLKGIMLAQNGHAWMINQNEEVLYSPNPENLGKPIEQTFVEEETTQFMIKAMVTGKQGMATYYSQLANESKKVQAAYFPVQLDNNLWSVAVVTPETEILETISGFQNKLLIAFFIIMVSSIIYSFSVIKAKDKLKKEIEQRMRAKEALYEAERSYSEIFNSVGEAISIHDIKTSAILDVNKAMCQMFGYAREEALKLSLSDISMGSATFPQKAAERLIQKAANEGAQLLEWHCKKKNGEAFWVEVNLKPISIGKNKRVVAVARDISERQQTEYELRKAKDDAEMASRAKTQFLANMSHEFRTPLNGIIWFSRVLLDKSQDVALPEKFQKFLENINISGLQLSRLINDVLEISRIEAGKSEVNQKDFDLRALVQNIFNIYQAQAAQKGVIFTFEVQDTLPQLLHSDPDKLNQVLVNLVGNAIKFTSPNKKVFLLVEKRETFVVFKVIDQGVGIPKDRHDAIFEIFEQADGSTSRQYGGTGLGLAISKKLIELLGGSISVKSEVGQGTEFSMTIPLVYATQPDDEQKEINLKNYRFAKDCLVLVVEDNAINQAVVQSLFDEIELTAVFADDGQSGINKVQELHNTGHPPDLILMDIHLPRMSGMEAAAKIRQNPLFQNIPIVAVSADAFMEQQQDAFKVGILDYLVKPIELDKLIAVLQKYLRSDTFLN